MVLLHVVKWNNDIALRNTIDSIQKLHRSIKKDPDFKWSKKKKKFDSYVYNRSVCIISCPAIHDTPLETSALSSSSVV